MMNNYYTALKLSFFHENLLLLGKVIMVIGGRICPRCTQPWTNDVEIVSPDPTATPVPYCLSARNPFRPFGSIHGGGGAVISESVN